MPDPMLVPTSRPAAAPLPPASPQTTDAREAPARADADAVVEDLTQTQARAMTRSSQRAPSFNEATRSAAAAFEADGSAGLHQYLSDNRGALGAMARRSSEAVERAVGAGADGVLASHIEGQLRSGIIREARRSMGQEVRRLDNLSQALPLELEGLRSAEPNSPVGALAASLGIRGDDGDLARAQASIEAAKDGLDDLLDMLQGRTWMPGDFPESAARVAVDRGLGIPRRDTVLGDVLARRSADEAALAHHGAIVADVLYFGAELAHAAHGAAELRHLGAAAVAPELAALSTGVAVGFGVMIASVGVGLYIHHLGEEQHAERIAAGRRLGL